MSTVSAEEEDVETKATSQCTACPSALKRGVPHEVLPLPSLPPPPPSSKLFLSLLPCIVFTLRQSRDSSGRSHKKLVTKARGRVGTLTLGHENLEEEEEEAEENEKEEEEKEAARAAAVPSEAEPGEQQ